MALFDFQIPESIVGDVDPGHDERLARGPFVAEYSEGSVVGIDLDWNGDEVIWWDGGRSHYIDDTFSTTLDGETIRVSSETYETNYTIRPLRLDDAELALPPDVTRPETLDELVTLLEDLLTDN